MIVALRVALYIQLAIGLAALINVPVGAFWMVHFFLGFIIAAVALIALRPDERLGTDPMRTVARFVPLLALASGYFGTGMVIVWLHVLLGIVTIGLVEMAAGRQRRALARHVA